nr:hypothetical protein Iba_chr14eCG4230 [Ipomoea batatas]
MFPGSLIPICVVSNGYIQSPSTSVLAGAVCSTARRLLPGRKHHCFAIIGPSTFSHYRLGLSGENHRRPPTPAITLSQAGGLPRHSQRRHPEPSSLDEADDASLLAGVDSADDAFLREILPSPEELATMRSRLDAQINYELNPPGNEFDRCEEHLSTL